MENFELSIDGTEFCTSPIFRAIKTGDQGALLTALHLGEDVTLCDLDFKCTFLHVLVSSTNQTTEDIYVPMVYQLSNAGVDVNAVDYRGQTALELAIRGELQDIMVALLRVGADATERDYREIIAANNSPFECPMMDILEKYHPGLWAAVRDDDASMVHMLLNSWCRVCIQTQGRTLLQFAQETDRSLEIIQLLDDFLVTLEFVHATLAGDEKRMLEFLMDSKPCDPYIMDISYQEHWSKPLSPRSLRDTAIAMGHTHVLHLLPEGAEDLPYPGNDSEQCRATLIPMLSYTDEFNQEEPSETQNFDHSTVRKSGHSREADANDQSDTPDSNLCETMETNPTSLQPAATSCIEHEQNSGNTEEEAEINSFSHLLTYSSSASVPVGSLHGFRVLSYTRNWERVSGKKLKPKANKPKSKLCIIS